jgi:hypothetical protein
MAPIDTKLFNKLQPLTSKECYDQLFAWQSICIDRSISLFYPLPVDGEKVHIPRPRKPFALESVNGDDLGRSYTRKASSCSTDNI